MSWSGLPSGIEAHIIPEPMSGCWMWLGGLRDKKEGYGGVTYKGKPERIHRVAYKHLRGEIPSRLALDHLCRNKLCCNPDHLEPVTWAQNISRGAGVALKNKRKTHCPQGHEYTPGNTYVWKEQRCRLDRHGTENTTF